MERLTSKKFTKDELAATTVKIREVERDLKAKERELKKAKTIFEKAKDPTLKRGIASKKQNADLFSIEDVKEIDGIYVWGGEDILKEDDDE